MKPLKSRSAGRLKVFWLDYRDTFRLRIWWLFGAGCLLGIIGFSTSLFLPETYLSQAVIERSESDGLATLTSEIFTASELEEIVKREHLIGENGGIGSMYKAIGLVRDQVKIRPPSSKSFLLTYSARDRHVAQKVNEALVALLIQKRNSPASRPQADVAARERKSGDASATIAANESSTQTAGLRVLEPPTLPLESLGPERIKFTVIGFLLGIVLGAVGAIAEALLDDRIRSARDLTRLSGFPVLASIPKISGSDELKDKR